MTVQLNEAEKARNYLAGVGLAEEGAAPGVIEIVTGMGIRRSRAMVKKYGIPGQTWRRNEAQHFYDKDHRRVLYAQAFVVSYTLMKTEMLPSERLLSGYRMFKNITSSSLININNAFDIIRLVDHGQAYFRQCTRCKQMHLMLSSGGQDCYVCREIARHFCKGCGSEIHKSEGPARCGRRREYCESCDGHKITRRERRRRARLAAQQVVFKVARQ